MTTGVPVVRSAVIYRPIGRIAIFDSKSQSSQGGIGLLTQLRWGEHPVWLNLLGGFRE